MGIMFWFVIDRSGGRALLLQHGAWGRPGHVCYWGREWEHSVGASNLPSYRAIPQTCAPNHPAIPAQQHPAEQGERRSVISWLFIQCVCSACWPCFSNEYCTVLYCMPAKRL